MPYRPIMSANLDIICQNNKNLALFLLEEMHIPCDEVERKQFDDSFTRLFLFEGYRDSIIQKCVTQFCIIDLF